MDDIREKLKPCIGKRVTIRGVLSAFSDWKQNYREVGRACISMPEMDGEVIADHVWVMGVKHWFQHKGEIGKQVEFAAVVNEYQDFKRGGTNYHLIHPDELQILHEPVALAVPEPPADEELPLPEGTPVDDQEVEHDLEYDKPTDALETLRQVKTFIRAIGGQEQVEKVAKALEGITIPVPQLITWLKELAN